MAVTTLTLDPVADVVINLSPTSATRKAFNLALLIGAIPEAVTDFANTRIVRYAGTDDMLAAGFKTTDALYKAAVLIFGQEKVPKEVAIGNVTTVSVAGSIVHTITTNAATGDTITIGGATLTAGTGFAIGTDIPTTAANIATALNANSTFNVKYHAVASGNTITVTEITAGGGNTPTAATKTGTIVITSGTATTSVIRTEYPVETVQALRQQDWEWYLAIYCDSITDSDISACAAYVQTATPTCLFLYTTSEASALTDLGIFNVLKGLEYKRVMGQYSTQHPNAITAIAGYAMGAMSDTINSAYSLAYKSEVGVNTENANAIFTESNVSKIKGYNGNVYINRGNSYNVFEEGHMAYGYWFDEMIFLDKMQNDVQMAIMDVFVDNPKVAQTENGMNKLENAIKVVLDDYVKIGFVAPGEWDGGDLLNLSNGDTLPSGYLIQRETIAGQSQTDRDNRIAPNIYACIKLAGAIHHAVININPNR